MTRRPGRNGPFSSLPHAVAGVTALLALAALAVLAPSWGRVRRPAVVKAAATFSISPVEPGRYLVSLRDGSAAGADLLARQQTIEFERNELVEMVIDPSISPGATVAAGRRLAFVRSLSTEQQLQQVRAEREALLARRALLAAGGDPVDVTAAEKLVEVARAEHRAAVTELERTRALAEKGLLSELELELLEQDEEVSRLEVEHRSAEVEVARSVARPQELEALDAEIQALTARVEELERLVEERSVCSPIPGVVNLGITGDEIQVRRIDRVFLAISIPEASRGRVSPDASVRFTCDGVPGRVFEGRVVGVSDQPVVIAGVASLWASAELENADQALTPGMTGVAELRARAGAQSLLARLVRRSQ